MKAIIMAGGEGSRLRPLTCDCPKPMVPVMGRPVMAYALDLLKQHGVHEIGVTLQYLPERIREAFSDGQDRGLSIQYWVEQSPLGTAGSVKQAQAFLDETFVVLSGDGLTDCDLTEALAFHRQKKALATMVLKRVDTPLEYGVVITSEDGRVLRFMEKPGWNEVFSDAVNTGIYILEPEVLSLIPETGTYDFGKELFPALVERGDGVYGYAMEGYWCDIGDTAAYIQAHIDMLDGKVNLPVPSRANAVLRMPGALVEPGAQLIAPCFIGAGARISAGAQIGPYGVVGEGAQVEPGASVKRSVLWRGARVLEGGQARGCVLGLGATLGEGAQAYEHSVLGDGAMLGRQAMLMPGVRIWPRKRVSENTRVEQNLVWSDGQNPVFMNGALMLDTPQQAALAAQAYQSATGVDEVVLAQMPDDCAAAMGRAVVAGLLSQGVRVVEMGEGTLPQLRYAQQLLGAPGALLVRGDALVILEGLGIPASRDAQRKIEGMCVRQDFDHPFRRVPGTALTIEPVELMYARYVCGSVRREGKRHPLPPVAVHVGTPMLMRAVEAVLLRLGVDGRVEWDELAMELAPNELGFWIDESGEKLRVADAQGILSDGEWQLLLAMLSLSRGSRRLILPIGATRAVETLAQRYQAAIEYVKSDTGSIMKAMLAGDDREMQGGFQCSLMFDGLFAMAHMLELLSAHGLTVRDLLKDIPPLYRRKRTLPVRYADKGRILRALAREEPEADLTDGLRVFTDKGWAWITPASDRAECMIMSEASDAEIAKELCDFYAGKVQKILEQPN